MATSRTPSQSVGDTADSLPEIRRFTREEFERAGEAGLFGPDERLELIGGKVVQKVTPQNPPHATGVRRVENALRALTLPNTVLQVQLPLALSIDSEPEPDVAIVSGRAEDFEQAHPTTALLVVEVADLTLRFDRTIKASLYARAGIPEYWILNLPDRVLEVLRDPAPMSDQPFGHHYRSVTRFTEKDRVCTLLSVREIAVDELLPVSPQTR